MNKLLIIAFLLFFCACKEDHLDIYSGKSSIYFPNSEQENKAFFSFGYMSAYIQDSIIKLPVIATGAAVKEDRPYKMLTAQSSTMVEGVDYEFLNKEFVIKANKLTDTIRILLHRSATMREKQIQLSLALQANEQFSTEVSYQDIGTGSSAYKRYYTTYELNVDDIAGTPWFWDKDKNKKLFPFITSYLGDYSAKKIQLMIGRYELDAALLTKDGYMPGTLNVIAWGTGMQAYLYEMALNGTPILDENELPMKMGSAVQ